MIPHKQHIEKALRWSERYTKTDMVYLAKNGFWVTLGQGVGVVASFLLSIALANLVSPTTYGIYKYILAGAGILASFSLSGFDETLVRYQAKTQTNILADAWQQRLRGSILVTLLGIGTSVYYFWGGNNTLALGFLVAGVVLPLIQAFSIVNPYLEGNQNFKRQSTNRISTSIGYALLMFAALLFGPGALALTVVYYAIQLGITGWFYFSIKRHDTLPIGKIDTQEIHFANHLSLMRFVGGVADQIDKIILFHYLGPIEVALFSFATAPVDQLISVVKLYVQKLSLPRLALRSVGALRSTLPKKVFQMFVALIPLTIIYVIATPLLYRIFFSQYLTAIVASQFYAISILVTPVKLFSQTFVAHKMKRFLYIQRLGTPILKIVLSLALIPHFGIIGAVISTLTMRAADTVIATGLFFKIASTEQ